jgi:GPH family glycoside/pentoside/hexuronide:cation symporter
VSGADGQAATARTRRLSGYSWAIGGMAPALLMGAYSQLVLYYLVYQVQLDPGWASTLLFITRIADLAIAPLVGVMSDRTRSRLGRRRPYLLAATILMPVMWLMLFHIPVTGVAGTVWAVVALLLLSLTYSLYNIPHMAMANDITSKTDERVQLMFVRVVCGVIGGLLGGLLPLLLEGAPGQPGYTIMSICLVFGCGLPMAISVAGTRGSNSPTPTAPTNFFVMFKEMGANRPFLLLLAGNLTSLLFAAGQLPVMLFFIQSVMKLPIAGLSVFTVTMNVVALVSAPLFVILIRRFGMPRIRSLVMILGIVYSVSFTCAQPHEPVWGMALRAGILGLVFGGWQLIGSTMRADVIDYDFALTGSRREGLFASFFSFAEKTSSAAGVLMVGIMLSAFGFDKTLPANADQGPLVTQGLYLVVGILPAIGYVIALVSFHFYKLDRRKDTAQADAAGLDDIPPSGQPVGVGGAVLAADTAR